MPFAYTIEDQHAPPRQQPQAAEPPSAEAIATTEADRQTRRAKVKEQIAAAQLAEQRFAEIGETIGRVEQVKEQLAAAHVDACGPIQCELSEIESRQIELISARRPTDGTLEERRKALLDQLQQMNTDLEREIAARDQLIARLTAERSEVGRRGCVALHMSDLINSARPDLLVAHKVAATGHQWAVARLESAKAKALHFPGELTAAEVAAAEIEVERTKRTADAAYRAVLDE